MNIVYHSGYNISIGPLGGFHPFDGRKFERIYRALHNADNLTFHEPSAPCSENVINAYVTPLTQRLLKEKRYILQALGVPYIPMLPFSFIDRRVLRPMRWGVAGTVVAAQMALDGQTAWNLAGGYHHASPAGAEGFCVYNDVGIALMLMRESGELRSDDRILIVDVDAHQGNGNSLAFFEDPRVTILDIYNDAIYPASIAAKQRVDHPAPLPPGADGERYLEALYQALSQVQSNFRLAFVVAGTDVLKTDPLGGMALTIDDVCERDRMIAKHLARLGVPPVFLGAGGYSKESAEAMVKSIQTVASLNSRPVKLLRPG